MASFNMSMANTQDDLLRAAKQFLGRVVVFRWSDAIEGIVVEPPPAPRRYLCIGISLGTVRLIATLDFGSPGWFAAKCHSSDATVPPR